MDVYSRSLSCIFNQNTPLGLQVPHYSRTIHIEDRELANNCTKHVLIDDPNHWNFLRFSKCGI